MFNKRGLSIISLVICFVLILSLLSFAAASEFFKVKLTLFERFIVMTLLPREGSYRTLKIVQDLQMALAPTEEENALAKLKDLPGGGTDAENWNAVELKEIIFGDVAKGLVIDALNELDKEEKLTQQHISLYEKFITYAEKPKEDK